MKHDWKILCSFALCVLLNGCTAPVTRPPTTIDAGPGTHMGRLGRRLGTYLTIEGVRSDTGKVGTRTLRVDTIDGRPLNPPIDIWIDNVAALPADGQRIALKGYESGRYIGLPPDVERALGDARQAPWQFYQYFLVVPIDVPAGIEFVPERS
jgi:hypothetical protein